MTTVGDGDAGKNSPLYKQISILAIALLAVGVWGPVIAVFLWVNADPGPQLRSATYEPGERMTIGWSNDPHEVWAVPSTVDRSSITCEIDSPGDADGTPIGLGAERSADQVLPDSDARFVLTTAENTDITAPGVACAGPGVDHFLISPVRDPQVNRNWAITIAIGTPIAVAVGWGLRRAGYTFT